MELIDRQAAIDVLNKHSVMFGFHLPHEFHEVKEEIRRLPSAQPTQKNYSNTLDALDCVSRQAAIDAIVNTPSEVQNKNIPLVNQYDGATFRQIEILGIIEALPSAQPEQRYTEEELRVFEHGISLILLSKRSSQHWHYDEDTATEIKFLERLYDKVSADMKGGQG